MIDRPYPSSAFTPDGFRPAVWAPDAERVELVTREADDGAEAGTGPVKSLMGARRRRLVGRDRAPERRGPLRVLDRRERSAPRPALGAPAGRRARHERLHRSRRLPLERRGLAGRRRARRDRLRAARRHVHRRRHAGLGDRAARPPRRARCRSRRADARSRRSADPTAGATTGSRCTRCTPPTAAPTRSSASSTPAHGARSRGVPRRRLQPPRPVGQLPVRVRPVLHRPPRDALGAGRSTSTTRARPRCARSSSTTRCAGSTSSTSTRCAWTRCTRSSTTPTPTCSRRSRRAPRPLSGELARPLSLIAESDRNDPATVAPVATGGLGMTAQWADDVHHAVRACLTGERHGWFADFADAGPGAVEKVMTRVFLHDGTHSSFRGSDWGAKVPRDVDPRRFVAFGTSHDQVGNRALGDRPSAVLAPGELAALSGARAVLAVHADDLHGRGVGPRRRRSASSPTTRSRSSPPRSARAGRASSTRPRATRSTATTSRCRTRRTGPRSSRAGSTGASPSTTRCGPRCCAGTGA